MLTLGSHDALVKAMVEELCPRFAPGGQVLYVNAGGVDPVFEVDAFATLGVVLDEGDNLPDLVVHMPDRNWLILTEAAGAHGPVVDARKSELAELFASCTAGLVYVSCFRSREAMREFAVDLAWETEAWCADEPTHLIHFNGERLLGPYE